MSYIDQQIPSSGKVAILLCTYQGEAFLEQQLDSLVNQTYPNWTIYISDDGSQDKTREIINQYRHQWGHDRIKLYEGPRKGFVANFMSLVYHTDVSAEYFAFADQDDIWELDKLDRALNYLHSASSTIPALYCTRTRLIDKNEKELGFSTLCTKKPCFENALMQNIAGGNTMVFNQAARNLMKKVKSDSEFVLHDWWTYLIVTACGGMVYYDKYASVRYRQHDQNLIGINADWLAKFKRIPLLINGYFIQRTDLNIHGLLQIETYLTPKNRIILNQFRKARTQTFFPRLIGIIRTGVFCQTITGNLKLFTAVLLKKI